MQLNMANYLAENRNDVYKGAMKITKDPDEANDLVQKLYLYYATKGTTIDSTVGKPWTYIYGSMYKRYHTERRRRREFLTLDGDFFKRDRATVEPENLDFKFELQKYLNMRPKAGANLVKNRILDLMLKDYSLNEIAQELGLQKTNVRSQRRHLIVELRKIIKQKSFTKGAQ